MASDTSGDVYCMSVKKPNPRPPFVAYWGQMEVTGVRL